MNKKEIIYIHIEEEIEKNNNLNVLNGKITWKEMKKDVKRQMRNYVKQFYYERKDDNSNEINTNIKKV